MRRVGFVQVAMLLWMFVFAFATNAGAEKATSAPPQQQAPPQAQPSIAAVVVDGKTLFSVEGVLSFPAQARADAIGRRIQDLADDLTAKPESLHIADAENSTDIMAGDLVLMSVTDQDGKLAGESRQKLAQDLEGRIRGAVVELRKEYSGKNLLLGGIYAVAATLVLVLLFVALGRLFPKLHDKIDSGRGTYVPSLHIQKFEMLTSDRIVDSAIGLARLLRVAISLVAIYFYVWLVLGFFAWTRGYAELLLGYVIAPLKLVGATMVGYLPNVVFIVVISLVAYYAIKLVRVLFTEIGKQTIAFPGFHAEWAEATYKIVRFLILVLAVIVISPYLPGAKSPAFKGVSIFIGVLFSLGSSSAVANVVAGTILTYMRAFRLGDRVQIADTVGDVVEVSFLVTRIRTIKNVEITIANSMVLGSHIVNYSAAAREKRSSSLILHTGGDNRL